MARDTFADSLWAATAPAAPDLTPLTEVIEADVAIVGAGYTGLSTALHLARAGRSVAVIEAAEIGHGGSGRNNGQVIPHYTVHTPEDVVQRLGPEAGERLNRLIAESAAYVFDLIRAEAIDCDAAQRGWVQPAHSEGRVARARLLAKQWAARGAAVDFLDRKQTADMLGTDAYFGAWTAPTGGHVQPLAFARGLARAAIRAGARVFVRSPVTDIAEQGDRRRVTAGDGSVTADNVVLATNAYSDALWPGLARSFVPVRVYQIATAPLGDNLRGSILPGNQAMSDSRAQLRFFRYDRDGRLVTGGGYALWQNAAKRARRSAADILRDTYPQAGEPTFEYYWDGMLAMTPERLPRLHRLAPGVTAALGYSGRGIALSVSMGRVVADWLGGVDAADLPVPITEMAAMPGHVLAKLVARAMIPVAGWRDAKG